MSENQAKKVVVTFVDEEGFLFAKATGQWNLASVKNAVTEIRDEAVKRKYHGVLIDIREVEGSPSLMERHELGLHVVNQTRGVLKGAIFIRGAATDKHLENVVTNRGAKILFTPDREEAVHWLLAD